MVQVFVSYKQKSRDEENDSPRIAPLVKALSSYGYDVWWAANLTLTANFIKQVNANLDAAGCIIVAWSERSIHSNWVLDEAYTGFERECLIPIRLDNVKIPVPFGRIQTADFRAWSGDTSADEWQRLVAAVESFCGPPGPKSVATPTPLPKRHSTAKKTEMVEIDPLIDVGKEPPATLVATVALPAERAKKLIVERIATTKWPITSAALAHLVRMAHPEQVEGNQWFGQKSFRTFFESLNIDGYAIESAAPGRVMPTARAKTEAAATDLVASLPVAGDAALDALLGRLRQVAEVPRLMPEQFQAVFKSIAKAVKAGNASLTTITTTVRDELAQTSTPVSRVKVSQVLKGAMIAGMPIEDKLIQPSQIGYFYASSLYRQCRSHDWDVSVEEGDQVLKFLGISD